VRLSRMLFSLVEKMATQVKLTGRLPGNCRLQNERGCGSQWVNGR